MFRMRCWMLRFLTAGESHGPELLGILEGIPAGLAIKDLDWSLILPAARWDSVWARG